MDENNNVNQETGFVLNNNNAAAGSQQDASGQADQTVWQQGAQSQTTGQTNTQQSQADPGQAWSQPQAMPSGDNTYRFQNVKPEGDKKKKEHKGDSNFPKMVAYGAVFGLIAAVCFFGLNSIFNVIRGKNSSDTQVGSTASNPVQVTTVSGGAAGVSDVSGIVENVMPAIVAITEKSTQTSYFGQSYSSQGAGSGFIVKQDNDQLLIVTNNHVVADADDITVQFNDGESVEATVKGTSESNDLAVLTVSMSKLKDSTKKSIKVASLGSFR